MLAATVSIVAAGLLASFLLAWALGLDTTGTVVLVSIVATGTLAVAVAAKIRSASVGPTRCPGCSGLISPHAPHCKHCGRVLD